MARLIKKDLSIQSKDFKFNFIVRDGITVVTGDSSTGKTLFFKLHRLKCLRYKNTNMLFINYENSVEFEKLMNSGVEGKIVLVDNADIIVYKTINMYRAIHNSNNQFIFFGRDIDRYDNGYKNVAILSEKSLGSFRLEYLIRR